VHDLHECRNCGGTRLVDLLEDHAVSNTLLVAFDDLVVSNANTGVAVLEEPVGVVVELLVGLHGDPPKVEGIPREIIGRLEI
jgi:hypothetical protein